jgi:hypothetical protein
MDSIGEFCNPKLLAGAQHLRDVSVGHGLQIMKAQSSQVHKRRRAK